MQKQEKNGAKLSSHTDKENGPYIHYYKLKRKMSEICRFKKKIDILNCKLLSSPTRTKFFNGKKFPNLFFTAVMNTSNQAENIAKNYLGQIQMMKKKMFMQAHEKEASQ
jgi:hypothetical protein